MQRTRLSATVRASNELISKIPLKINVDYLRSLNLIYLVNYLIIVTGMKKINPLTYRILVELIQLKNVLSSCMDRANIVPHSFHLLDKWDYRNVPSDDIPFS